MTRMTLAMHMLFLTLTLFSASFVQSNNLEDHSQGYWVFFTDKEDVHFDPHQFFDEKAIERRIRNGLCLYDTIDFPVNQKYIAAVKSIVPRADVVSRWFNAVHVYADEGELDILEALSFVKSVEPASLRLVPASLEYDANEASMLDRVDAGLLKNQLSHMKGNLFHSNEITGKGVRIAVFDAGFRGVDSHPAFRHVRKNNQIIATWDFHRDRKNVYTSNVHGTMVLSTIAGIIDGQPLGLATDAEFLLARTEIRREPLAEEKYWLAAVEWADQHGADIINSSLGYIFHRYFPEEMDGKTSLVARAANIAAGKGILVVNAAGNQGNDNHWRIIVTPADADSVLTVGALQHPEMVRAPYSSVGPTADGRMKPNVSALGTVVAASRRRLAQPMGTSFASPLVTGFAACLWQMFPGWTNMELFRNIEQSSSLYPYYDYAHGFGIPQASRFFQEHQQFTMPTFDIISENDSIHIIKRKIITGREINQNTATENEYLYYQKMNADGRILRYYVINPEEARKISMCLDVFLPGQLLRVHYRGYTAEFRIL